MFTHLILLPFLTKFFLFKDLGKIEAVRVWHDNAGKSPSWFVSRIVITNILKGTQTTFLCRSWLGIGIADGKIDRIFLAATEQDLKSFATLFLTKTSKGLTDEHLWFSVAMRPARSHFTRCQRLSCCFCVLLCTMLANAMFYKQNLAVAGSQISLGSYRFSWRQLVIGIQSAIVVIPINVLIVQLFRKAAPSVKIHLAPPEEGVSQSEANDHQGTGILLAPVILRPLLAIQPTIRTALSDQTMDLVALLNEPEDGKKIAANTTKSMPSLQSSLKDDAKQRRSIAYRKESKAIPFRKPPIKAVSFQDQRTKNAQLNVEDVIADVDSFYDMHGKYYENNCSLMCWCIIH